jgi:type II secretory pathway pseudopilin PulG
MAISSLSSAQSIPGVVWQQVQQQQAQRNADQAEQAARSLQAQARSAQSVANRAQENARSISTESSQADSRANQAKQGLVSLKSIGEVQSGFDDLRQQISTVLSKDSVASAPIQAAPVVNSSGQQTGTLINVSA